MHSFIVILGVFFFSGAVDPIVVLYCTGILSNLLANNQKNKEFLYGRGAITTLYRVLINYCNTPAATPSQQQRIEDIQVPYFFTIRSSLIIINYKRCEINLKIIK